MTVLRRSDAGGGARDAALVASILAHVALPAKAVVAGVWPLPGEPDLGTLWAALHARGHALVLPETPARGEALRFRPWHPGCAMLPGLFGTCHPESTSYAAPDLLFVPLLAFDRHGYRLGYGGGYYDRTLAALPGARGIGYGFAFQQVDAVPHGPHDVPLHGIVTEEGLVRVER